MAPPKDPGHFSGASSGSSGVKSGKSSKSSFIAPATAPTPIGVPAGYEAPNSWFDESTARYGAGPKGRTRYQAGSGLSSAPQYFNGDDRKLLSGMPPEQLIQLQLTLRRLGYIDPKKDFRPGDSADEQTRLAFHKLLGDANGEGTPWDQYLTDRVALADQTGFDAVANASRNAPALPTRRLSNPDDIKAVFNKAGTDMIGHRPSDADLNGFVAAFQQREADAQNALFADQAGTGGGTVTDAPSLNAFVDEQLRQGKPEEYAATQMGENATHLLGVLQQGQNAGMRR